MKLSILNLSFLLTAVNIDAFTSQTPTSTINTGRSIADRTCFIRPSLLRIDSLCTKRENAITRFALPTETITSVKSDLIELARELRAKSPTGVFITKTQDKSRIKKSVAELEAVGSKIPTEEDRLAMIGDWTLVATLASSGDGKRKDTMMNNLPFGGLQPPPLFMESNPVQDAIKRSYVVTQRIRSPDVTDNSINRVDNVIEFTPLNTVKDLFGGGDTNIPEFLQNVDLNPLDVTKTKVTLVHKANVESVSPVLRTKIGLTSIVFNVAGKSQLFEPSGADVLGLNVPLGEFLQTGYFDTTYVDEDIRISRGKVGLIDQLRVFVRKGGKYDFPENVDTADMDEVSGSDANVAAYGSSGRGGTEELGARDVVGNVTDVVEDAARDVGDIASDLRDDVEDAVGAVESKIKEGIEDVSEEMETAEGAIGNVTKAVKESAEEVGKTVETEAKDVTEDVEDALTDVRDVAEDASDDVADVVDDATKKSDDSDDGGSGI